MKNFSKKSDSFKVSKLIQTISTESLRGKERISAFSKNLEKILPKEFSKKEKMPLPLRIGRAKAAKKRLDKKTALDKETGMFTTKKKFKFKGNNRSKNDGIYKVPKSLLKTK